MPQKLSNLQLETLVDIYQGKSIFRRKATIASLIRRDLIISYEDGYEVTEEGLAVVKSLDIDGEMEDALDAAFYLGKTAVERPELITAIAVGALLGAIVRKIKS